MQPAQASPAATADVPKDEKKQQAILLTAHSADLNTIPAIEQIDKALVAVVESASTPEQRQRVKDARTWVKSIGGKSGA